MVSLFIYFDIYTFDTVGLKTYESGRNLPLVLICSLHLNHTSVLVWNGVKKPWNKIGIWIRIFTRLYIQLSI